MGDKRWNDEPAGKRFMGKPRCWILKVMQALASLIH
jgi:hypothetical protein